MLPIKSFVRINKVSVSICIFLIIMAIVHITKPGFIYMPDGGFRQFGIGYRNKTVFPIWIISILTAILSYLFVLYYLAYL
jgi:sterol desaturase/sphingolipid hydroxylase (fatty acid hydroxylase superfamily)